MDIYEYLDEILNFSALLLVIMSLFLIYKLWKSASKTKKQKILFTILLLIASLATAVAYMLLYFSLCFKQCY